MAHKPLKVQQVATSLLHGYKGLLILPIIIMCFGLFFVFEASSIRALQESGDSFRYLKLQIVWMIAGTTLMLFFSFFNYKKLYLLSLPMMMAAMFLLVIVLIPGIGQKINGARRWIDLGFFSLQPTEFAKLATIIYLSSWFTLRERKRFFSFLFLIGIMMFLILMQPDMGTAIIIFSLSVVIYFLAGNDIQYLFLLLPGSAVMGYVLIHLAPYRFKRLTAFLDPTQDPGGAGYHINQILISLSNGGFFGRGFGASRQKYLFLPEAHTDSIFAIMGEELGFIGGMILIFLYIVLIYKLYIVYRQTNDRFGKLLVGGVFAFFGLQSITNLAAMASLIPLTGVPLPFVSYGGSHIMTSFILMGIAVNIARHAKGEKTAMHKAESRLRTKVRVKN
jgi:cell division protein FtsW